MKKKIFIGLFVFLTFLAIGGRTSFAVEEIKSFFVDIKVNEYASILVVEKITYSLDAEKHGIFRYVPVKYKTKLGQKTIKLEVQNVTRDGALEPYEVTNKGSNVEIKIGDKDKTISGEHLYEITYLVKGAISYFEDYDEFYWNVTGAGWPASIAQVNTRIELPQTDEDKEIKVSCFHGKDGANETCQASLKDNVIFVNSTTVLYPGEGLTTAVSFPKGTVREPSETEKSFAILLDNLILAFPIFIFLAMLLIWKKHGQDPKGYQPIIAEYEPPREMKPTLVGALIDGRPETRDITAGIIYLAEQGYLKIKRLEKSWMFGSVDYELELVNDNFSGLEKIEQDILKLIFDEPHKAGDIKKISSFKNNTSFSSHASKFLKDMYQEMADRGYYHKNPKKVVGIYLIIAVVTLFAGLLLFTSIAGPIGAISAFLSFLIVLVFAFLMGKRTEAGAEAKDRLLGFKLFLSVTEKDRLAFHNAPEKTGEQFMEFLPYAIAMGVEKKWAKQFDNIYISPPSWYQGHLTGALAVSAFSNHMSGFSETIGSSMSAASGGSGTGGGGFAGGGFGGGGGGSW
ncbi:MAG TPA: DUF2207 domain-containing protein [Candidatus Paceibacterota bacterium]|nr:DUF2207 domain-containing protein [Candidatus Paceibacterota bacterium]